MNFLRRLGWAECLALALVLVVGRFYFWTAIPEGTAGLVGPKLQGYYSLLTRGFLRGHLYLDQRADPFLATLKDPWDPGQRAGHGLHDASYFRGRYYLYFGVAPVVLLLLPFRLITGLLLDESAASPIFACIGLALSAWLVCALRRRYYPRLSSAWTAIALLAVTLGNMVPTMLRRPSIWEVPIACGYACCMAALVGVFQSLSSRRPGPWLALAGAAFGAAVASRPTYLFGCPALFIPLWYEARERRLGAACRRDRAWLRHAASAFAPLAAIGLGLAVYNQQRFGSPLDFGFRHVMAGAEDTSTERIFAWPFLLYNLRVYLLAPARWTEYFPFAAVAKIPPQPHGYLGIEDPYGLLPNMPFVLLALGAGLLLWRRSRQGGVALAAFALAVALAAVGTGLATGCFGGAVNRYEVDFLPAVLILACVGLYALADGLRGRTAALAAGAAALLAAFTAFFNVCASLRHNELLRVSHPAIYSRLAHRWNQLSYAADRLRGVAYGPVEMTVVFPRDRTGHIQPLIATGADFLSDYLFVHYLGPDSVRFCFEHTSYGTLVGDAVHLDLGAPHTLRLDLGSLYPPGDHPFYDRLTREQAGAARRVVRVTLDGRVAFDGDAQIYDPVSPQPSIGTSDGRPGLTEPFSGRILSWRRLPGALPEERQALAGPLRMELVLPPFTSVCNEPLLCTGVAGHGDLVYIRYEGPGRVSFGYDHWGVGGGSSLAVSVDPNATQVIEIDSGALHPAPLGADQTARLVLRLNGQAIFDLPARFYGCDPHTIVPGKNPIGASTAQPEFSGRLLRVNNEWL
ncbi:MAG TPA: hypothetical protein VHV47_07625 [Opitutaceae bacterium]|jgi:hypothetical protein|nr:hypothetical protein [Opitutaceae bacterium]